MILLLFFSIFSPSDGEFTNSLMAHLSDSLRLKCHSLPYRTTYDGSRCYIALTDEVAHTEANAKCNTILSGSKFSTNTPATTFDSLMLDMSKFHNGKSTGSKQLICVYDSGYVCEKGESSSVFPGKCVARSDKPVLFLNADSYCKGLGMEFPSIGNDLENRMIRGEVHNEVWIKNIYSGEVDRKWHRDKYYGRYTTCSKSGRHAGAEFATYLCKNPWGVSALVDKSGYWTTGGQGGAIDVVCVKNAENDFTKARQPCVKTCIKHHKFDEETGMCEWTGPTDACMQLVHFDNRTKFIHIQNFPKVTATQENLVPTPFNDAVVKVIVRRGCMYYGWSGYKDENGRFDPLSKNGRTDLGYGEHVVPCHVTGELDHWGDGLSLVRCFCDPTAATLNDHEPAPPPKKKCIEHHVFNEETQSCEWKHEEKFCGELISHDGRRQMVEIQDWPKNRRYDVDHWNNATKQAENFHTTITEVIVRQHCWMTLYRWDGWELSPQTLKISGYGKHQVQSYYNGMLGAIHDGTHRIICDCLSKVAEKPYTRDTVPCISQGGKPCVKYHEFNENSGKCEWTGPTDACLQLFDANNRESFLVLSNFPAETARELLVGHPQTPVNDVIKSVVVRRGCMYSGWSGHNVEYAPHSKFEILSKNGRNDLGYGEHKVPCYYSGELDNAGDGLSMYRCFCDPTEADLNGHDPNKAPPKKKCIEHHQFNEKTQSCEWKHDPKYCGELISNDGRRQFVEIPDWPKNRKYDVDHWNNVTIREQNFHATITEVIVRQHCWMTLNQWGWWSTSPQTLKPSGYGKYQVKSFYNGMLGAIHDGTHRVTCECLR